MNKISQLFSVNVSKMDHLQPQNNKNKKQQHMQKRISVKDTLRTLYFKGFAIAIVKNAGS